MKTKIASCVYATALLLPLTFVPVGYAQSSAEQPPAAASTSISDPARVYLKNGSILDGVQILQIDDQYVVLRIPNKEKDESYPVKEVDKILFSLGQEYKTGIVRKNGDQLFGKVKSYKQGIWRIALEGSGELTFEGKGSELFQSISFNACCKIPIPGEKNEIKKRGANVEFIFGGETLSLQKFDETSMTWNPLTIPKKKGIERTGKDKAEGIWTGYWYAPKAGQYVVSISSDCNHGYGCFGASFSLGGVTVYHGKAPKITQKIMDFSEGYHPVKVHIVMWGEYRQGRIETLEIKAKIVGETGEPQTITPASLYHD